MGFLGGENRQQPVLLPQSLAELVPEESVARVIDLWVDSLNMAELGFVGTEPSKRGRPAYSPADLLKLYLWGYANGVRTSRKLEAACHLHVECMWLLGRLAPDHKTICNFRRANAQGITQAAAAFAQFARGQGVLRSKVVAVDGTKVRAVSSSRWLAGEAKLKEMAQRNIEEVQAYLRALDEADVAEDAMAQANASKQATRRALDKLRAEGARIDECLQQVLAEKRIAAVTSEPQARAMKSLRGAPGYNVQAAVDTNTHLVVHQDVCTDANDSNQLAVVVSAASAALGEPVTVVADSGYTNGHHIQRLHEQGVEVAVPARAKTNTRGLLPHSDFTYQRERDCFVCPQGKVLEFVKSNKGGMRVYTAKPSDCGGCAIKDACTHGKQRHITRHPHQDAMDKAHHRWQTDHTLRRSRGSTVEHFWGTLKTQILGGGKLLLKGLQGARIEIALGTLAYNLKRTLKLKGNLWFREAVGA